MGKYLSPSAEALINKEIQRKFEKMGARVKLGTAEPPRSPWQPDRLAESPAIVDVKRDGRGEFFDIRYRQGQRPGIDVLDVRSRMRHLALQVTPADESIRSRFLCGHDERAWFVAAVPEGVPGGSASVPQAMDALKPPAVLQSQAEVGLKKRHRYNRKNPAFVRQGEWFFIPTPWFVWNGPAQRNRPLQRSGGKPHIVDFAVEGGGEVVYVSREFPAGISLERYRRIIARKPARAREFQAMRRGAGVFVRGRVRHADHKTILLRGWHQVVMNTESRAAAMRHVVFLD